MIIIVVVVSRYRGQDFTTGLRVGCKYPRRRRLWWRPRLMAPRLFGRPNSRRPARAPSATAVTDSITHGEFRLPQRRWHVQIVRDVNVAEIVRVLHTPYGQPIDRVHRQASG